MSPFESRVLFALLLIAVIYLFAAIGIGALTKKLSKTICIVINIALPVLFFFFMLPVLSNTPFTSEHNSIFMLFGVGFLVAAYLLRGVVSKLLRSLTKK